MPPDWKVFNLVLRLKIVTRLRKVKSPSFFGGKEIWTGGQGYSNISLPKRFRQFELNLTFSREVETIDDYLICYTYRKLFKSMHSHKVIRPIMTTKLFPPSMIDQIWVMKWLLCAPNYPFIASRRHLNVSDTLLLYEVTCVRGRLEGKSPLLSVGLKTVSVKIHSCNGCYTNTSRYFNWIILSA